MNIWRRGWQVIAGCDPEYLLSAQSGGLLPYILCMQCLPKSVVCVNSWSMTMVSNTIYVMSVLYVISMVCAVPVVCYV